MKAWKGISVIGIAALALLVVTFWMAREVAGGEELGESRLREPVGGSETPDLSSGSSPADATLEEAGVRGDRRAIVAAETTADPESPSLRVRVITAEGGDPLQDVIVRAYENRPDATEPGWRAEATTGLDGIASLRPPHGMPVGLSVRGTSVHGSAWEDVDFPTSEAGTLVTLVVPTTLDTHWYLRVMSRGEPVPGATVRVLYLDDDGESHDHATTISDDAGLARVDAWSWMTAQARIRAGHHGLSIVGSEPGHDTPASAQVVELWPAGNLVALVLDGAESPLPGLTVRLAANTAELAPEDSGRIGLPYWHFEGVTDVDGRAAIENAPAETTLTYTIELDSVTLQKGTLTMPAAEDHEQRFVVSSEGGVVARVVDATGAPLVGKDVWLVEDTHIERSFIHFSGYHRSRDHLTAATDASGRAHFDAVALGQWHVGVADFSGELTSCAQPITLTAESPHAEVEIAHLPARWVAGTVVDADGDGVSGVHLSVYGGTELGAQQGKTDEGGEFRVGPLTAGSFSVNLYRVPSSFIAPEPLEVQSGEEALRIVLVEGGTVTGTIRDRATGAPAKECYLVAFAYDTPRPNLGLSRSYSAEDSFELHGLPPSAVAILVRHDDGRVGYVRGIMPSPERATEGVVIDLHAGTQVSFRYEGPAKTASVLITAEGVTLGYYLMAKGVTERVSCPPGTLNVLTTADGQEPDRVTVELSPDMKQRELVLCGDK